MKEEEKFKKAGEKVSKKYVEEVISETKMDDAKKVIELEDEILEKVNNFVKEHLSEDLSQKFTCFILRIKMLIKMVKDFFSDNPPPVPWYSIAAASAAILYFFNPFDIVPDIIPIIGYGDDLIFLKIVWGSVSKDIDEYIKWSDNKLPKECI